MRGNLGWTYYYLQQEAKPSAPCRYTHIEMDNGYDGMLVIGNDKISGRMLDNQKVSSLDQAMCLVNQKLVHLTKLCA